MVLLRQLVNQEFLCHGMERSMTGPLETSSFTKFPERTLDLVVAQTILTRLPLVSR